MTDQAARRLDVDDEPALVSLVELSACHPFVTADDGQHADQQLDKGRLDLVLTDMRDPGAVRSQVARTIQETSPSPPAEPLISVPFRDALKRSRDSTARDYLVATLRAYRGNVTHAARHAGLERESLYRLLKRYRLRSEDFRPSPDTDHAETEHP